MQLAEDIKNRLPDTVKQVALPAILAGAGGGALSGYMSSKANPEGETPQMRRRRILRNALVGTVLGGTAGAAIPTGLKMLTEPYFGEPKGLSAGTRAVNFGLSNALPIGAAAAGGTMMARSRGAEADKALGAIKGLLPPGEQGGAAGPLDSVERIKAYLMRGPGAAKHLVRALSRGEGGDYLENVFKNNELMSAAGHRGLSIKDLTSAIPEAAEGMGLPEGVKTPTGEAVIQAFRKHLSSQGPLSGAVGRLAGSSVAGQDLTPLAEAYSRFVRPSSKALTGRMGILPQLGLLGAGTFAANKLQNAVTGN